MGLIVSFWVANPPMLACAQSSDTVDSAGRSTESADRSSSASASGSRAYLQGHDAQALDGFEASYARSGDARTLLQIAAAAEKLGRDARAQAALQAYLQRVPDAPDSAVITRRIALLEARQAARPVARAGAAPARPGLTQAAAPDAQPRPKPANPAGPLWVWVAAGAVVVAGVVAAGVILGSQPSASTAAPIVGNVGGTVQTLGGR